MEGIVENQIINGFKQSISRCFHSSGIKSACLAQSYMLYEFLKQLTKEKEHQPKLVMGYIINTAVKIYYGHFWVEYNGIVHDVATDTYLMDYDIQEHSHIKKNMRILSKKTPIDKIYKNIDNPSHELTRTASYIMCMNNKFLEDVKHNAPPEIYKEIKRIFERLIKK
jgi:hypothetical protein